MLTTIQGVYRNGNIELDEEPQAIAEGTPVIVTFLPCDCEQEENAAEAAENAISPDGIDRRDVDLRSLGIDKETAGRIRASLLHFEKFWDGPEMDAYNNYEANKAKLL